MHFTKIYEQLFDQGIEADEFGKIKKGYEAYLALRRCGWMLTPLRLVYHKPQTTTMVVMPFLNKQIVPWGVELNGLYFSLKYERVCELYDGYLVARAFGDSAVFFGVDNAKKRSFSLPDAEEIDAVYNNQKLAETVCFLWKNDIKVATHISTTYFIKTPPEKKQIVYQIFNSNNKSFIEAKDCANVYYVLHADNDKDLFCSLDCFGKPNKSVLQECLSALGCELPQGL